MCMKSQSFSGTVLLLHPETDEAFAVDYEGVYQPANITSLAETSSPDESHMELINLLPFLEKYESIIKQECWDDFHEENSQ